MLTTVSSWHSAAMKQTVQLIGLNISTYIEHSPMKMHLLILVELTRIAW